MRAGKRFLAFLFFLVPWAKSYAAFSLPDPHYCQVHESCHYYVAENFVDIDTRNKKIDELFHSYKMSPRLEALTHAANLVLSVVSPAEAWAALEFTFKDWAQENDGQASAFLGITNALQHLVIVLPERDLERKIQGLDLIVGVNKIEGDRIKVRLNKEIFMEWIQSGALFELWGEDGFFQAGSFRFNQGDWGGSLHRGYDIQGYTSITKLPRLQINFRFADGEADIDLDGFPPLKYGIIPNPMHLTYENSDIRQWYQKYVKRFGIPGFGVVLKKFEP